MKKVLSLCLAALVIFSLFPVSSQAAGPAVDAPSALLMDAATGTVLFEQNAHEKMAPASVTKVMTMLLIMEAIDSGRIGWSDTVTASEAAAAKGGSQIYLKVGETMTVEDLLKSVAVSSANDAACALAEHIAGSEAAFVALMNEKAAQLGMKNTHFVNCTGLDDDENAKEHLTTAYDIALMSRALLKGHPDIKKYTTIWMDTVRNGTFGLSNTNKLVRFYSGATGLKTGYTSQAGFCLSASAQRDGMELIAVVLGCKESAQRFSACRQLLDYGFASYALIDPVPQETLTVPVKLGHDKFVTAVLAENKSLVIDKGQKNEVTVHTQLEEQITAPVSQGQRLGTLTVKAGEQVLAQIPLVAAQSVTRLSFGDIFLKMLRAVCMASPE